MVHRRVVACIAFTLIGATGCGNRDAQTIPAGRPNAAAVPTPQTASAETIDTLPGIDTTVVEVPPGTFEYSIETTVYPPPVIDQTQSNSSVVATAPLDTTPPNTELLGGVTIDDPLPPQSDASDQTTAEVAVRYAYQHWILVDLDKALRSTLVEDGEGNVDGLDQRLKAIRGTIDRARFAVDTVKFTDADHAEVRFRIRWGDAPSPIFPDPLDGTAVFQSGTWRITRTSLCLLAFSMGEDCNRSDATNPVPPTALEAPSLPAGYVLQGGPASQVALSVPGGGYWYNATGDSVSIDIQVLAGVSKLSTAEADVVLASTRYGVAAGTPIVVGDRPGRLALTNRSTNLVYIRSDDLIVSIVATGLSIDDLTALAAALHPLSG